MTSARGLERSRKAASARSVLCSWTNVMQIITNTKPTAASQLRPCRPEEIDRTTGQQHKHRLARHVSGDREQVARFRGGQFIIIRRAPIGRQLHLRRVPLWGRQLLRRLPYSWRCFHKFRENDLAMQGIGLFKLRRKANPPISRTSDGKKGSCIKNHLLINYRRFIGRPFSPKANICLESNSWR